MQKKTERRIGRSLLLSKTKRRPSWLTLLMVELDGTEDCG